MKKLIITLGLVLTLMLTSMAAANVQVVFDATQFPAWVESDGIWRTVGNRSFKDSAEFAPTEEALARIMRLATLAPTSTGMNDYLLVVLKDVEQQRDVVGVNNANNGTVTVLVFGDRLLPTDVSKGGHTQSVDRGYYNVGIVSGYLNLGAISQGYGTRMYMTTEYTRGGSTRTQTTEDVYLKDKGYQYVLGFDPFNRGDENRRVDAYGNLKFVCAIVIGTLDEEAETTVTDKVYHENWVIAN